jgi:DNA invertase Pin-like site-specific DNA recombinase
MERIGIYARVSTADQSVDMQLVELREFCGRRADSVVVREYIDEGVSGAKASRPQLNRLMDDAQRHKLDTVVVWKFDRFARSVQHLVLALAEFQSLDIAFVSVRDGVDLGTPVGRLQYHIIAAMSEFERSLITERVRSGVRHAMSKRESWGRKRLVIDAGRVDMLRRAGYSWSKVAADIGQTVAACRRAHTRYLALPKTRLAETAHVQAVTASAATV